MEEDEIPLMSHIYLQPTMPSQAEHRSADAESSKATNVSHGAGSIHKEMSAVSVGRDVDPLKLGVVLEPRLGDGGARRAELMQNSWGKHGKFWVFFGLGLCMFA